MYIYIYLYYPIGSMYGICTNMCLILMVNVGKYTWMLWDIYIYMYSLYTLDFQVVTNPPPHRLETKPQTFRKTSTVKALLEPGFGKVKTSSARKWPWRGLNWMDGRCPRKLGSTVRTSGWVSHPIINPLILNSWEHLSSKSCSISNCFLFVWEKMQNSCIIYIYYVYSIYA